MVDHDVVAIPTPVVGGHRHRPRQGGADRCSGGDGQIHPRVAPPFSGEGVSAVAEFRGDHAAPVLSDGGAEPVRPDEGHIRPSEPGAASCGAVADQVIDAVRIALLLVGDRHTHGGGDILPDGTQIFNGNGGGVVLLCFDWRIAALHRDCPGALLIGDEAVHEVLSVSMAFCAEVQSMPEVKNKLQ